MLLQQDFYERPPEQVARELLGKILVHGETAGKIVETEAYLHKGDLASHSANGKTSRNAAMFGKPGTAYVFVNYGIHYCFNTVTAPRGSAVLIRALEPLEGIDIMQQRRGRKNNLTNGPGRLTEALAINLSHNFRDLTRGNLHILNNDLIRNVGVSKRIGITRSSHLDLRFYILGNKYVSKFKKE